MSLIHGEPRGSVLYSMQTGVCRAEGQSGIQGRSRERRLAAGFLAALRGRGYRTVELLRPEIYAGSMDRFALFGARRPLHLILKTPENVRVLKGAYNIGVLASPSLGLGCSSERDRLGVDAMRMVERLDEVWVGSRAAQRSWVEAGLGNVHVVPCPLPEHLLSQQSTLDHIRPIWPPDETKVDGQRFHAYLSIAALLGPAARRGKIFACCFGASHCTGDILWLLQNFDAAAARRPDVILIVICEDPETLRTGLKALRLRDAQTLTHCSHGPDPLVIATPLLSPAERAAVLTSADFFLSLPYGDEQAQFVPETMALGCIPIVPHGPDLTDCVESSNAILIPSEAEDATIPINGREPGHRASTAGFGNLPAAVKRALSLDDAERSAYRTRGETAARRLFGLTTIQDLIEARLAAAKK